jgi:hypothetical protein
VAQLKRLHHIKTENKETTGKLTLNSKSLKLGPHQLFPKNRNFYKRSFPLHVESEMRLRKVAFPAFMLATSLYILLPTADEVFIHPAFGMFLSIVFQIPLVYGVLLSIIIYRAVGVGCLLVSLLFGGRPIYYRLKEKFRQKF